MFYIRTTKTGSSSTAVQVVEYSHGQTIVIKHIGSASRKEELALLKHQTEDFVEKFTGQQSLFSSLDTRNENKIIQSRYARSAGFKYTLLRQLFTHLFHIFVFDELDKPLLNDLVMARIVNPSSKLQAITNLKEMFDVSYSETDIYRELPTFSNLKEEIEKKIITFAKKNLNFNFTVVFYDVTTLYFETFKEDKDNFKKPGFSKDNKFNQPQIVIGLIVNQDGFPVSYDIYSGNTFEGHTLIPSSTAFKKRHNVKNLTVIADAAMISLENVEALIRNNINYIVGARVSNLPERLIREISSHLNMVDKANYRLTTEMGILICDFSKKRYWKNKYEVEKSFRMAKSDLQTRPVYHFKNKAIHSHILICFMALAVGTYMELSTKKSLQKILRITKEAVDVKIKDKITGDIITIHPELSTELQELLEKLRFTY